MPHASGRVFSRSAVTFRAGKLHSNSKRKCGPPLSEAHGGKKAEVPKAAFLAATDRQTEKWGSRWDRVLDLTQIRYFLALARTLNFTRAAAQCDVTQPALSRGIQRLEETLGAPLVLRERSLTQLTEFGRAMLPLLQHTHDAAAAARSRADQHRRQQDEAPLRLGLGPYVPLGPLLPAMRELVERVDRLDLELLRLPEPELLDGLLRGELDLAIMPESGPLPERLNRWRLWCDPVHVLMPQDHRLADGDEPLPLEALAGESVIAACGAVATAALERLRETHGLSAQLRHNGTGPQEVTALVALGLGLAVVPPGLPIPPGTVTRQLQDEPPLTLAVVMLGVAGRPMNRAVTTLHRLLRGTAAQQRAAA